MFGETAGRQCACNALFSVCWSLVRKISWLDHSRSRPHTDTMRQHLQVFEQGNLS